MTIHILSSQLANQIAAGEVVDRPASIIKELVENSIDAGANEINIDIEQGGCKRICIRDNGCGIAKDELALALTRHATSKIHSLDDLEAITSLGFRGEALASISSVSRLTLTSKPQQQTEAWLVYVEGRDMSPIIKPATHPTGTTVEVLDIFYNTPARRRFLKTEKTEFSHIYEVIRRIALASPNVVFHLRHNGKLVKLYHAANITTPLDEQIEKRITAICGLAFMQKAIKLSWQHDDLSIKGWVSSHKEQETLHYFYVNGRVVKDRLLTHALKQAFQQAGKSPVYSTDQSLSYILYLELDPHQVDVNVHPAKHEVRFHEARLVHDFVHQAVIMALDKQNRPFYSADNHHSNDNRHAAGQNIFNPKPSPTHPDNKIVNHTDSHTSNHTNSHTSHFTPQLNAKNKENPIKGNHIKENKAYGYLVSSLIENDNIDHNKAREVRKEYTSVQQQAVIESLFPKRSEPLLVATHEQSVTTHEQSIAFSTQLGRVLTIINNQYVLLEKNNDHQQTNQQQISLLSLKNAQLAIFKASLLTNKDSFSIEHLLIPLSILLNKQERHVMNQSKAVLAKLNFEFNIDKSKLQLTAVPKLMRKANWQQLLPDLITLLSSHFLSSQPSSDIYQVTCAWLSKHYVALDSVQQNSEQQDSEQQIVWDIPKVIQLLVELEQLDDESGEMSDIIKPVDLSATIALF